jgi:probable HAF family extracellular repeat protein
MKSSTRNCTTLALLAMFVISAQLAAETRYRVINLDTLGGTSGGANSINNRGWITGTTKLAGNQFSRATLWISNSAPVSLGTLGGPNSNSAVAWPVKNENGLIVGISETEEINPLGERFSCPSFFGTPLTRRSCRGFLWANGVMTPLPTLGGYNSYATAANNRGQAVGWAENTVRDPTCVHPRQVLQFRAVIWGPKNGDIQALPPLGDDATSAATAINDQGQVVGISGKCDRAVGRFSARHAVLWENGSPRNIGDFGGIAWNTPTAINHQGTIAGFSDFPGDDSGAPNYHAFISFGGGPIQDLKTVGDDPYSLAFGINEKNQVVGQSLDADFNSRAFIWENGKITDLNSLVPAGSPFLIYANDINERGEIAGQACNPDQCAAGVTFAFLAIPDQDADSSASAQPERSNDKKVPLPRNLREQLRAQWGLEFGDDKVK